MPRSYQLLRTSVRQGRLRWGYANRIVDDEGRTLYVGQIPNGYFKKPVEFSGGDGLPDVVLGTDRSIARKAFVSRDAAGTERCRIDIPFAARLRRMPRLALTHEGTPGSLEIVSVGDATAQELDRLVSAFVHEFVVQRDGETIARTGDPSRREDTGALAQGAVTSALGDLLADLRGIPGRALGMAKGERQESLAGQLTVNQADFAADLVLALLVFRTYIYGELRSPAERWWQGD